MAVTVIVSKKAQRDIDGLPAFAKAQVAAKIATLANWPDVSGCKALKGGLRGLWRARTGNYRIIFSVVGSVLTILSVDDRKESY